MKKKDSEIQSRREFFKKAAKTTLPILAIMVVPSILTSCEPDEEEGHSSNSGSGGNKGSSCRSSCAVVCRANAQYAPYSCKGTCKGACTSCRGFCAYTSK